MPPPRALVRCPRHLLLSALMSDFPSLMSSLMNLLVLSSSASCDLSVSRKCGLSRQQSLNSSAGSPILPVEPSGGGRASGAARRTPATTAVPQVWRRLAPRAGSAGASGRLETAAGTPPVRGRSCEEPPSGTRAGGAAADPRRRGEANERGHRLPASSAGSLLSSLERLLTEASAAPPASGAPEPASDDLIPRRTNQRACLCPTPRPPGDARPFRGSHPIKAFRRRGLSMGAEPTPPLGPQSKPRPLPLSEGCRTRAPGCIPWWVRPRHPNPAHPMRP